MGRLRDIAVIYGDRPFEMVGPLLDYLGVTEDIPRRGTIGIKPNLVLSKPSSTGATTDPEIVAAVIEYLHARDFRDLIVLESAWVGDTTKKAFRACGYTELSKRYGVPLVDLKKDKTRRVRAGKMIIEVCRRAENVDYLINIPVLKAHCQTKLTCALKNLKGCIPDAEKRRFHTLGLHQPIACLNTVLKTDLAIVDGIVGDLTFEEGGTPVHMNRLFAGRDPVLVDAYAATLIGYAPGDIEYIPLAEGLGVGTTDLDAARIEELNRGDESVSIQVMKIAEEFSQYIAADLACSACYGGLIHALKRLSDAGSFVGAKERIAIGQGYKERTGPGIGIGTCTQGLACSLKGCPPSARKIVDFLTTT